MGSCCEKQDSGTEQYEYASRNSRRRRMEKKKKARAKRKAPPLIKDEIGGALHDHDENALPTQAAKNAKLESPDEEDFLPYLEDDFDDNLGCADLSLSSLRSWSPQDIISSSIHVKPRVAEKVMKLLDDGCTIPFIARYRLEVTGGLGPEVLRDIQECYDSLKTVQKKAETLVKTLEKEKKLDPSLQKALANATTISELELTYAPYKSGSKRSLAERAKQLGLEESALNILTGTATVSMSRPERFVKPDVDELSTLDKVLLGWQHSIASAVSKEREVLDYIKKLCENRTVSITAKKSATATKKDKAAHVEGKTTGTFKFENYFDFEVPVKNIKAHQVMALNRGENLKVLTVKVVIPDHVKQKVISFCHSHWPRRVSDPQTAQLLDKAFEDAYKRLLEPLICRQTRSQLTKSAEKESVLVFTSNLKHLLLTPPIRGHVVCGIDPGFSHGCKMAVLSPSGEILVTDVLMLHGKKTGSYEAEKLRDILLKHNCEKIGVGNGTACRETECFLSDLIKSNFFKPLNVQYCIVNESGISIYSVTKEAEVEMPNLSPNLRSAVSLARRLQDPLLEYVKVDPKHIGIGMYQHDVNEKQLKNALNEVMIECVSFVGVDLNVSSEVVLGKIAGLTSAKVKSIIEWREQNGGFKNRKQLLVVKGLGPKAFEQCAGFVKIFPNTCQLFASKTSNAPAKAKRRIKPTEDYESLSFNPLDMTVIHPESYDKAERFLTFSGVKLADVGTDLAIEKVKSFVLSQGLENLADNLSVQVPTMKLICDALQQPLEVDIRSEFEKPLFRQSVMSLEDLVLNQVLTGRVCNSTNFGAFVDIGVGQDGLIHTSNMGSSTLALGDHVDVQVISLEKERKRIGLKLLMKEGKAVQEKTIEKSPMVSPSHSIQSNQSSLDRKDLKDRQDFRDRRGYSLDKLIPGTLVEGTVKTLRDFGFFVDIGARKDGLVHKSKTKGLRVDRGNKVTVKILNVDIPNQRISLELQSVHLL